MALIEQTIFKQIKLIIIMVLYVVVSPLDWLYRQLTGKPERRFID